MIPEQQLTEGVQAERVAFCADLAEIDPACIKVVDESRLEVGQHLGYGYSERGKRCFDTAVYRSHITYSLVGWLGLDGSGVVALHEGTVKGWTFRGFVKQYLLPYLKAGDVVIWDNARIHKVEGIREMIEGRGARVLFLPRYSPDLSPIELAWSKIKHLAKRLRASTWQALEEAIAVGVAAVKPADAWGWFKHCGYVHQPERV